MWHTCTCMLCTFKFTLLTPESEQSSTILWKTHDLQHTPDGAHGGRTKNQVNGAPFGIVHSALKKNSAARRPFSFALTTPFSPLSVTKIVREKVTVNILAHKQQQVWRVSLDILYYTNYILNSYLLKREWHQQQIFCCCLEIIIKITMKEITPLLMIVTKAIFAIDIFCVK